MSAAVVKVHLDWSGSKHYDAQQSLPCFDCGRPTKMRDKHGRACHHSCAEAQLERMLRAIAAALVAHEDGETVPPSQQLAPSSDARVPGERVSAPVRTQAAGER